MSNVQSDPRWRQVPAQRSSKAVLEVKFRLVVALLVTAAALGLFASAAWLFAPRDQVVAGSAAPEARDTAQVAVEDYLSAGDARVPTADTVGERLGRGEADEEGGVPEGGALAASGLAWLGYDRGEAQSELGAVPFERHAFHVLRPDADDLVASVAVLLTPHGHVVGSTPSLVAYHPAQDEVWPAVDWRAFDEDYSWSGSVDRVVADWAQAYAADDRRRLKDLTGDGRAETVYPGLDGFEQGSAEVTSATRRGEDLEFLLVRAGVELTSAEGFRSRSEYDLLLQAYATDAPRVVAWGPAGSGLDLEPLTNALDAGDPRVTGESE